MEIQLTPSYILTNEHSASSYGQPVLVNRGSGAAYGPGDILQPYPSWGYIPATRAVERMTASCNLNEEQQAFVAKFVTLPNWG